jgi:DNA-binding response OmpR family regulator
MRRPGRGGKYEHVPTHACEDTLSDGLVETKLVVVVVGQSLAGLELIEAALRDAGHRVLTTTKPEEVVVLAWSIRIDVLIGDRGDALVALEEELRLVQPDVRVVRVCDPDELKLDGGNGAAIARPVSLHELDAIVRTAVRR